jgi:hypothetical protein
LKPLLFLIAFIIWSAYIFFLGGARVSGNEIEAASDKIVEAEAAELVATGRQRTLESLLRACRSETVYITVVTSSEDTEGVYWKATGKGGG